MSLLDSFLGGARPDRRGPSAGETALVRATDQLDSQRSGLTAAANRYASSLASGQRGARSDYIGAGVGDVQSAIGQVGAPTSYNQAVQNTLLRGKGLARIASSRGNMFDSQLLRDRIAYAGGAAQRRGMGLGALTTSANISEQMAATMAGAKRADDASKSEMTGALTGIAAGFGRNAKSFSFLPGNKFHVPHTTKVPGGYMDVNPSPAFAGAS